MFVLLGDHSDINQDHIGDNVCGTRDFAMKMYAYYSDVQLVELELVAQPNCLHHCITWTLIDIHAVLLTCYITLLSHSGRDIYVIHAVSNRYTAHHELL